MWPPMIAARGNLVVIEIDDRGRLPAQVLLEIAVNSANHRMSNQRSVLVVRPQPFRAADKEILAHEGPVDAVGIRCRAAGAQVAAPGALHAPVLASASRSRKDRGRRGWTPAAGWPGLHVVVGHAQRDSRSGCRSAHWPADRRKCRCHCRRSGKLCSGPGLGVAESSTQRKGGNEARGGKNLLEDASPQLTGPRRERTTHLLRRFDSSQSKTLCAENQRYLWRSALPNRLDQVAQSLQCFQVAAAAQA